MVRSVLMIVFAYFAWSVAVRRAVVPALVGASLLASVVVISAPAGAADTPAGSRYVPLSAPVRVLDTRTTTGGHHGKVAAGKSVTFTAKASGVATETAVVLNLTVVGPTAGGHITAYPAGGSVPTASNVNFAKGETRANLTVVKVPANDKVTVYNGSPSASIDLLADLAGAFTSTSGAAASGTFVPMVPRRLLDTRTTTGGHHAPVASKKAISFAVGGKSGIPPDASAAVLNLTVTAATGSGPATAYPASGSVPGVSNLNFTKGQTVANLAVVPLGSGGKVGLSNGSSGSVQFIADVAGYFVGGVPATQGTLGTLAPTRVLDTNTATGGHHKLVAKDETVTLPVTGKAGVPTSKIAAVVLNVTVASPAAGGHLIVYGSGSRPNASNLNFSKGRSVPNLVVAAPDSSGNVHFYNGSNGTLRLVADISGYLLKSDLPTPAVSVSHYIRSAADLTTLGQQDAAGKNTLVVLDIGAQLNDKSGVEYSATSTSVTYGQLVTQLQSYLDGFGAVSGATVAVATNNGANDWVNYSPADRGSDWATKVMNALTPGTGVSVVGADDIEYGFYSTAAQAEAWESAYLGAATTKKLLFIGDANDCPTAFGSTASCSWTQAQEYQLAGGKNPTQIQALPQIYSRNEALKWANVDHTGGSKITFLGALTEHAADATGSQTPQQGYAALWNALAAINVTAPAVATDLDIPS